MAIRTPEALAPLFKARALDEWCARLSELEVPHSPLRTPPEVLASAQAKHLKLELKDEHKEMGEFWTVRSPLSFDGAAPREVLAPPTLGEHNSEILGPLKAKDAAE